MLFLNMKVINFLQTDLDDLNASYRRKISEILIIIIAYASLLISCNLITEKAFAAENISCDISLGLPVYSYEGHKVMAEDYSIFHVGYTTKSVKEAYDLKIMNENFDTAGNGSRITKRLIPGGAEMVFENVGNHLGLLDISLSNGLTYSAWKQIEVRQTPKIIDQLWGNQKENRRQCLSAAVAVNPKFPLVDFYIELAALNKNVSGTGNASYTEIAGSKVRLTEILPQSNSQLIKTRALKVGIQTGHDAEGLNYFAQYSLEFLTKDLEQIAWDASDESYTLNKGDKYFQYTVYAKDVRGNTDIVTKQFTVKPDLTPIPIITLAEPYFREEGTSNGGPGSGISKVVVIDDTVATDGDVVERIWELTDLRTNQTLTAYKDLSFGSKKKIEFSKLGVGPFKVKLKLKDDWQSDILHPVASNENTLSEYVSSEDIKYSEAEKVSEVGNVEPVVSFEALKTKKAKVLIFAASEEEFGTLQNQSGLKQEFLRMGTDAEIKIIKLEEPILKSVEAIKPKILFTINAAYGYEGRWTSLEKESYAIDNKRYYTLEATWPGQLQNDYPIMPYYISAYDIGAAYNATKLGQAPTKLWSVRIDNQMVNITKDSNIFMGQDDDGAYIYLIIDNKTLMIEKKTGALLKIFSIGFGKDNYLTADSIFSIKSNGVYKINMNTGVNEQIFTCSNSAYISVDSTGVATSPDSRRLQNKVNFLYVDGKILYRGKLNLGNAGNGESVSLSKLSGSELDPVGTKYSLIGLDVEGKMLVRSDIRQGSYYISNFRTYDKNNNLVKTVSKNQDYKFDSIAIFDENGLLKNFALSSRTSGTTYKYFNVETFGIEDGFYSAYTYKSTKYLSSTNQVFAAKVGNKIYLSYGGIWDYVLTMGYAYDERTSLLIVDLATSVTTLGSVYDYGMDIAEEFGKSSEQYMAIANADNRPGAAVYRTKVLAYGKELWQILESGINKYLENINDGSIVVICDKYRKLAGMANPLYNNSINKIAKANGKLIYTDNPDPTSITTKVLAASKKSLQGLNIKANGSTAYIERNLALDPYKTYYYEYDLKTKAPKDFAKASFKINELINVNQLNQDRNYVSSEIVEDFDDGRINPFFTLGSISKVTAGAYRACDSNSGNSSTNRIRTYSDQITFTVPVGKEGILSFDYNYQIPASFTKGNEILINGVPWDNYTRNSDVKAGTYIHKEILKPGLVTIRVEMTFYGMLPDIYKFYLDNIKLMYITKYAPSNSFEDWAIDKNSSVSQVYNGYSHITGNFDTPCSTLSFGGQEFTTYFEDFNDLALIPQIKDNGPGGVYSFSVKSGQYTHTAGKSCSGLLEFTIPADKIGIAKVNTWSSINRSSINYAMDGIIWRNTSGTNPQDPYTNMGSPYNIRLPNLLGKKYLSAYNAYSDYTGIYDIELSLFQNSNGLNSNRYFMDKSKSLVYLEKNIFGNEGKFRIELSEISSNAPDNEITLQNLKVYSIEGGVKCYVIDECFGDMSQLTDWTNVGCQMSISKEILATNEEELEKSLVFKKGELISYGINYWDFEGDPSKKQYWRYTHEAFNDGVNPISGQILNAAINRFYIDGKYFVEHWQEDSTGVATYDKLSNVETLTLYIEGEAEAPLISLIKTIPSRLKEGMQYKLQVNVSDKENDILTLKTEVYDSKNKLIYSFTKAGIAPIEGTELNGVSKYPSIETDLVTNGISGGTYAERTAAIPGKYTAICTLRDFLKTGIKSYSYFILANEKISAAVSHTDRWEENRLSFNMAKFGVFENTSDKTYGLEPRGSLVFWPGEKLELNVITSGKIVGINAKIIEASEYTADLSLSSIIPKGITLATGEQIWTGFLWNSDMQSKWKGKAPTALTVRFSATFDPQNGEPIFEKTQDVSVIMYKPETYWELRRSW